ncbi:MAG: hypothetical protein ACP5NV_04270 [Candidatus Woesearchaeota archaeon]
MKVLTINTEDTRAVDKVVESLKETLKPGDIILTGPIPKNILTKYFHVTLIIANKMLKGLTHSCLYLGNDKILDIDYKILRSGTHIEELSIKTFVQGKLDYFGGVKIYVVKPARYSNIQRRIAIAQSRKLFIANNDKLTHTLWGSLVVGFRYMFQRKSKFKEDMSFRKAWTCGHMVAYLMKKSKVNIGQRATYTFVPPIFVHSKHFRTQKIILLK